MSDEKKNGTTEQAPEAAAEGSNGAPLNVPDDLKAEAAEILAEQAAAEPAVRVVRTEVRELPIALCEEERRELDEKIGKAGLRRRECLEYEVKCKDAHKAAKEVRERIDDEIAELAVQIGEGVNKAPVDVAIEFEFATNTIRERRLDTNEVIATRAATGEERQAELKLVEPPPDNVVRFPNGEEATVGEVVAAMEPQPEPEA